VSDKEASPLINSILIVSLVSSGAGDVVTTAFGSNEPGAIVHSTAINDLVQGTSITRLPRLADAATLCLILPFAWTTRFCRRIRTLLLMWIFGTLAIIAFGVTLLLTTTNYLMGSMAIASLWTTIVLAELVRRYSALKAPFEMERLPQPASRPTMTSQLPGRQQRPVQLVYSYSHRDESLRDELETHLALLELQGIIGHWSDRKILAGEDWAGRIDEHFKHADVILLLISADFLSSNYCYEIEMQKRFGASSRWDRAHRPDYLARCRLAQRSFRGAPGNTEGWQAYHTVGKSR
jgi:hypothetical protein